MRIICRFFLAMRVFLHPFEHLLAQLSAVRAAGHIASPRVTMWLHFSALTLAFFLLDLPEGGLAYHDDALEIIFRQRTQSDWERVWHHESHSRCRERLVRHLFWACEKDIYRLTRRNSVAANSNDSMSRREKKMEFPWLESSNALKVLRMRRNSRGQPTGASITRECCTRVGCTWEEYAEYCPSNKRINKK